MMVLLHWRAQRGRADLARPLFVRSREINKKILLIFLDKVGGICSNIKTMKQINRKNASNWWWPAG
jgi:hypothetical protein